MAMQQDPIEDGGTDSIEKRPISISGLIFLGDIPRIHMAKQFWYVYVPPSIGSWRSPIEYMILGRVWGIGIYNGIYYQKNIMDIMDL